jgi:hypothetical protein
MPATSIRLRSWRGLPAGFGAAAAVLLAGALAVSSAPSRAAEGPDEVWVVAEVDGEVHVAEGEALTALARLSEGEVLFGHQVVVTGPDGSVVLTHGEDVVHMAPKSKLALKETSGIGGLTRLAHTMGKILVDVEKRPGWQFEVETPFLTGTVKGTSFTVTVDARGAQVDVHHGIVGVADRGGRSSADLGAGQSGRVAKDAGSKVAVGPSESSSGLVGRSATPAAAAEPGDSDTDSADSSSAGDEGSASGKSEGQGSGKDGGASGGTGGSSGRSGGSGKSSDGGGSSSGGGKGKGSDGGSSSGGSGSKGKDADGGSSEGGGSSDSGKGGKDKGDKGKDSEGGPSSSGKGGKDKGDNGNSGGNGKDKGKGKD